MTSFDLNEYFGIFVDGLYSGITRSGEERIMFSVRFVLCQGSNGSPGPEVTAKAGMPSIEGEAYADTEARALAVAHDLLARITADPLQTLEQVRLRERDQRNHS